MAYINHGSSNHSGYANAYGPPPGMPGPMQGPMQDPMQGPMPGPMPGASQNIPQHLPDLADLGHGGSMLDPPGHTTIDHLQFEAPDPRVEKFIRNSHMMPPEAGMQMNNPAPIVHFPGHVSGIAGPSPQYQPQPQYGEQIEPVGQGHSCLDVSSHVDTCPICTKLYSNDKTVYIIIIVILAIMCILLLKRVLEL